MILNLYEISDIYNVSRQYIQKKFKEFRQLTGNLEATRKDGRTALQLPDLKKFIEFLGYDLKKIEATQDQPAGNREATHRQPTGSQEETKDKDEMIKFLQRQLETKDDIIKQQNGILAMTQKNLNDLIQDNKKLKHEDLKKAELINKFDEDQKHLQKLYNQIDKEKLKKKSKEDEARVKREFKRLRKSGLITTPEKEKDDQ